MLQYFRRLRHVFTKHCFNLLGQDSNDPANDLKQINKLVKLIDVCDNYINILENSDREKQR